MNDASAVRLACRCALVCRTSVVITGNAADTRQLGNPRAIQAAKKDHLIKDGYRAVRLDLACIAVANALILSYHA